MKVALIQLDIVWEDKQANFKNAEGLIKEAAQTGCDIVVLPEMFSTGFSMNVKGIAEEEDGLTASFLSGMAKRHSINVIGGFAARGKGSMGKNVAHVYGRDGVLFSSYSKMHPFCPAGEHDHYEGGEGPVVFKLDGVPASIFICYDLRFPEAIRAVAREVNAVFVIANWPSERVEHWRALLKARAIENQCFVIGLNRIGTDSNGIVYPGASGVFGPDGREICAASEQDELVVCEFDPREAEKLRSDFPFLDDMRH